MSEGGEGNLDVKNERGRASYTRSRIVARESLLARGDWERGRDGKSGQSIKE